MTIKLVISGSCGRMGQAIARCALQDSAFTLGAALEAQGHPAIGREYTAILGQSAAGSLKVTADAKTGMSQGDVLIEFTVPEVTVAHAQLAQQLRKPMVIGTTGLTDAQHASLRAAATAIPIVWSPNMSIGVNVMFELVRIATERLGLRYAVEMEETHHQAKKDAPSGTAKRLQELLTDIRVRWGDKSEIPCRSIREGDVVGEHTVMFSGQYETLEVTHNALSRDVFAMGALQAARFIAGRPPGLYDMSHVLKAAVDD